jgi:hypothetical protein
MAEEPHSNSAGGKAFGHWLYNRRKGAEAWIKVGIMAKISEKDAPWITHMDYPHGLLIDSPIYGQFMPTFMGKIWEKHDELCNSVFLNVFGTRPLRFGRLCIFSTPHLTNVVTNTEAERDSMFWDHRIAMDRFHMVPPSMPRRTPRMPGLARPRTATTSCASGRFWRSRRPSCCTAYPSNGSWKAREQIPSVARKWEVGWS